MGCAFCKPMAAVTLTGARWDDAPVGQDAGDNKISIPSGARSVHIVTAATALYVAMDTNANAYSANGATALNEDGAPVYANNDADSPVVFLPVPEIATYLHLKGAGATSVTFYG
ncbi:MAG: hypothetical protein WC789_09425 [Lentisphaeria bacterium]